MPILRLVLLLATLAQASFTARVYAPVPPQTAAAAGAGLALYQPPSGPLSPADRLLSDLRAMDVSDPSRAESLAPLLHALSDMGVSEQALLTQDPARRLEDMRAAAEAAVQDARAKAEALEYEVSSALKTLPGALDQNHVGYSRALLSRLSEVAGSYGPYLERDRIRTLDRAQARLKQEIEAASRRVEARLLRKAHETARSLERGIASHAEPAAAAFSPNARALALYERATHKKTGWRPQELRAFLEGFGFELDQKTKHAFYRHPLLTEREDRIGVPGHAGDMPNGYVTHAMHLIRKLYARLGLPAPDEDEGPAPHGSGRVPALDLSLAGD